MSVAEPIRAIGAAFADGLRRILGEKLVGAYFYGAVAFADPVPSRDIDFHVIVADDLTQVERAALEELHHDLGRRFPPLGGELDGYYVLMADAGGASPPRSQMWDRAVDTSWALHRAHILAGRCIPLYGPDPSQVYAKPTWPEIEAALRAELEYVEKHSRDYPDYCILNLCRLIYSFETGDVVLSKAAAGEWARGAHPPWSPLIDAAVSSYAGQATEEQRLLMLEAMNGLLAESRNLIERASRARRG